MQCYYVSLILGESTDILFLSCLSDLWSVTKVCMCNSSFILIGNSSKLCMHAYHYVIVLFDLDHLVIKGLRPLFFK